MRKSNFTLILKIVIWIKYMSSALKIFYKSIKCYREEMAQRNACYKLKKISRKTKI